MREEFYEIINALDEQQIKKIELYIKSLANKEKISYLFNTNFNYTVNSKINGGKTFYKIPIKKKNYDGQELQANMPVRFAKCEPVPSGTVIRIKNAMEDWYINPKDTWNIVPVLVIFDYEIVKTSDYAAEQAIQNFNNSDTSYDDELPF